MGDEIRGSGIVCKGSIALGSGCGRCDRCIAEGIGMQSGPVLVVVDELSYANAWNAEDARRVQAGARVLLNFLTPGRTWEEMHPDYQRTLCDRVRAIVDAALA